MVGAGEGSAPAPAHVCDNCAGPIIGRAPNAVFCSSCLCERTRRSEIERGHAKWLRIKSDPKRLAARLDRRRMREADRYIDETSYRLHKRAINRRAMRRLRRRNATHRTCALCSKVLPVKIVGGRLSNRRLHDECRQVKKVLRDRARRTMARRGPMRVAA